jgi:branched-chain amino acid aminotransferase
MTDLIPFDQRDGFIWYNGEFVAWKDAKVHVLNHGLHYASCVFEGEKIYNGKIFKSFEHSTRLHASAKMMGFEVPVSIDKDVARLKLESMGSSLDVLTPAQELYLNSWEHGS